MKITPVDVAHKTFGKSLYGLEVKEVETYLKAIAEQLETLLRERNELREKLREKEIQISEYKDRDQLLKNTLTTASQMSEKIQTEAEKRAELVVQEAHLKASEIQRGTHDSLRRAYTDISDLKALRIQFETNMRALAHAHLALIEEGAKYMGMNDFQSNSTPSEVTPENAHDLNLNRTPNDRISAAISPLAADII